jgi:thymidylate synthase (FAD)
MKLEYLNHMGNDATLVAIARTCTGVDSKLTIPKVAKNIRNLIRDGHWSVFDHAIIQYRIEAPIYVVRQWMRHSAKYMEKSRRYTTDPIQLNELEQEPWQDLYSIRMEKGDKPEDARKHMPLDMLTKVVVTTSLRDALFLVQARLDSHAQKETQELATELLKLLKKLFPATVLAYLEYSHGDVNVHVEELVQVVDYLQTGKIHNEAMGEGIRRFIENATTRIRAVENAASAIKEPGTEPQTDGEGAQLQFDFGEEVS